MVGSFMWDVSSLVWLVDLVVVTFSWNMYCLDGQIVTRNKQASQSYPGWSYRQIVIMFFKVIIDELFWVKRFLKNQVTFQPLKHHLNITKLWNQVPFSSLSRWKILNPEKIKTDWVLWCSKVQISNNRQLCINSYLFTV